MPVNFSCIGCMQLYTAQGRLLPVLFFAPHIYCRCSSSLRGPGSGGGGTFDGKLFVHQVLMYLRRAKNKMAGTNQGCFMPVVSRIWTNYCCRNGPGSGGGRTYTTLVILAHEVHRKNEERKGKSACYRQCVFPRTWTTVVGTGAGSGGGGTLPEMFRASEELCMYLGRKKKRNDTDPECCCT